MHNYGFIQHAHIFSIVRLFSKVELRFGPLQD
jgi:hypothetical protein